MISKFSNSRGFAILYAVLMVSIILTISLTLLDISYKQLVLASINKESKLAYYAAVNALNCVNYWDKDALNATGDDFYKPFGRFDFIPSLTFISNTQPIYCAEDTIQASDIIKESNNHTDSISKFKVDFTDGSYADVMVIKGDGTSGFPNYDTPEGGTLIRVDGYNTSNPNNPRRVQRSLDSS
jgi:hypothetical protein